MSSIFEPSESINYNFVSGIYGFFSALCLLLLGLHFVTPQVEGFFITLLPFLPCFLWSLVVRSKWLKQQKTAAAAAPVAGHDGEAAKEAKKDQ